MLTSAALRLPAGPTPLPSPSSGTTETTTPLFERFLVSPGFAGVTALVAAIVAGVFAYVQYSKNAKGTVEERWWNKLFWAVERAFVAKADETPLPEAVVISALAGLFETSDKNSYQQFAALRALRDVFRVPDASPQKPVAREFRQALDDARKRLFNGLATGKYEIRTGSDNAVLLKDPAAIALFHSLRRKMELREQILLPTSAATYADDLFAALARAARDSQFTLWKVYVKFVPEAKDSTPQVEGDGPQVKGVGVFALLSGKNYWVIAARYDPPATGKADLGFIKVPAPPPATEKLDPLTVVKQKIDEIREFDRAERRGIIHISRSEIKGISENDFSIAWTGPAVNWQLRKLVIDLSKKLSSPPGKDSRSVLREAGGTEKENH